MRLRQQMPQQASSEFFMKPHTKDPETFFLEWKKETLRFLEKWMICQAIFSISF